MRVFTIFTIVLVFTTMCGAQDQDFTLNDFAPWNTKITHPDDDQVASISFLVRSMSVSSANSIRQNFLSIETPVIQKASGKRIGGIGFHAIEKNTAGTDLLKIYNAGVSLSYNLTLTKTQSISFGIQPTYVNKRTSLENITTGNQWLQTEFRFDPELDIGESIIHNRMSYFTFHSGITWHRRHLGQSANQSFISINAYHLNTPSESFVSKTSVPRSFLLNAGALIFHSRTIDINGQTLTSITQDRITIGVVASGKIRFTNSNPFDVLQSGAVELISKATNRSSFSFGFAFHQPGFAVGFSYQMPTRRISYFSNIIEFGITLSRLAWKPKVSTIIVGDSEIKKPSRTFNFSQQQKQEQIPPPKSDTEIIQANIQELSPVKAVQFELSKDFHFPFGKAELSEDAKTYLQELYDLLQKNPEYSIQVIGHTDNVGKPHVNQKLSSIRARAVANHLIGLGLDASRVSFSGKGDTEPVAPNDNEQNRSKNRRVQFIISVQQ